VPAGLSTLVKPFGTPFKVTPKGSGITFAFGDLLILGASLGLILLTVGGLVKNRLWPSEYADRGAFLVLAEFWALANVAVLAVAALIALETPRPRKEERFPVEEPAVYRAGGEHPCRVRNLSVSGALLAEVGPVPADGRVELILAGVGSLPARVVRNGGSTMAVHFGELAGEERDRLIRYLYSEGRCNAVAAVRAGRVLRGLLKAFTKR
jgi:cellulose synthase (UDP-forming)